MSNTPQDHSRRNLLIATSAVGAVGAVCAAVPFVASMNPSERAKAAGAPVEVDISALQPGEMMIVEWRQKPIWIMKRTQAMIDELKAENPELADPKSAASEQPQDCDPALRSKKEDVFVAEGICTHLGCSPVRQTVEQDGRDGFYCPCHGSRFDLAARVVKGSPAPLNLPVPPHEYLADNKIVIGQESKGA